MTWFYVTFYWILTSCPVKCNCVYCSDCLLSWSWVFQKLSQFTKNILWTGNSYTSYVYQRQHFKTDNFYIRINANLLKCKLRTFAKPCPMVTCMSMTALKQAFLESPATIKWQGLQNLIFYLCCVWSGTSLDRQWAKCSGM